VLDVVVLDPPVVPGWAVVVVVVGVPRGGLVAGAVWLAGLDGVGVVTVPFIPGLATM
jgi:hypothetical protein